MKRLLCAAAILMVAGLAVPAMAADVDDANNKISIGFYFPANNHGSFSMVGAGEGQGPAEVTSATVLDGRIKTTKVLHFVDGDVLMSTEGEFIATTTTRESTGTWTLTDGTGIYTRVSGGGEYHWFRILSTGILTGAYTGKMKLHDGDDE